MTAYSREVSELGEFGDEPNDNGPGTAADPADDKSNEPPLGTEIGDAVPPPAPEGEPAPDPAPTPQQGS